MKKIFLIGALIISITAITAFTQKSNKNNNLTDNLDCQYGRCSKIKDNGYQCKNCAQESSSYCWSHSK